MSLAMPTPVSDEAVERKPGLYWWQRETMIGREWTIVRLYYDRASMRIRVLGLDRELAVDRVKDSHERFGPAARLPRQTQELRLSLAPSSAKCALRGGPSPRKG